MITKKQLFMSAILSLVNHYSFMRTNLNIKTFIVKENIYKTHTNAISTFGMLYQ